MAADSSFDIVSEIDRQEVDNALNQAAKEISTRYDFRNVDADIVWSGDAIVVQANSEDRVRAALDVFQSKLIRRGISLKAIEAGEPATSGKLVKMTITLKQGIDQPTAGRESTDSR